MTRRTFSSSVMRFVCVCNRPAVSTITTSRLRARPASTASNATAAGSAPRGEPTKSASARCAQISSCSSAAARNVSAAPTSTDRPCSRSFCASLPIVVVFPVPFTPTTRTTVGCAETSNAGGAPKTASTSSARASASRPTAPRASSRRTSSAVACTPTSLRINASSSRSHAASSPESKAAFASSVVSARRLFASDSRMRAKRPDRSGSSAVVDSSPRSSAQVRLMQPD